MATITRSEYSKSGLRQAVRALVQLYPLGLSLFWLAPVTVALVIVPELLQHVVEISLGMFNSREQGLTVADAPERWAFGYAKIAGLVLAFLATARFWWTRKHGGSWWDLRPIAWGRLLVGLALFFGVGSAPELLEGRVSQTAYQVIGFAWTIALLPALFLLLSGLFGDRQIPFAAMLRRSWPWLLLTAVLAVLAFVPAQWLHGMNHRWAMGAHPAIVWSLMIFDSLLVGLLAGLTGTGLYLGYEGFAQAERSGCE